MDMDTINKYLFRVGFKNMNNKRKNILMLSVLAGVGTISAEAQTVEDAQTLADADTIANTREWEIIPAVTVKESYTDDVNLDNRFKQSDFVTLTTVGGAVTRTGPKVNLNVNYGLTHIYYPSLDEDNNEFRHNLITESQSEIIDDQLFFDVSGSIAQRFVDRSEAFSTSEVSRSANRDTVTIIDASPYHVSKLGSNFAVMTTRYRFNFINSRENVSIFGVDVGAFNAKSHDFSTTFDSGTRFNKLTWSWLNSYQALRFSNIDDDNIYISNLTVDYNYSRYITLIGSVGYNRRNDFISPDRGTFSGLVWRAGGRLTPGPKTTLEVTYGKEFFGNTWNAIGTYEFTPTLGLAVDYLERAGSSGQFIVADLQNNILTNNVDQAFLDQPNGRQRRGQLSISGVRGRTTITVTGGYEDNSVFFGSFDFNRKSLAVALSRVVSNKLVVNLSSTFFLEDYQAFTQNDFFIGYTASFQYSLRDDIILAAEYIHSNRRQQVFGLIDRKSNYISASISKVF